MMFEITEFKLFQKGHNGLEVQVKTFFEAQGGRKIIEPGSRRRFMPIGPSLRQKINALKYYYFILTNHWLEPYNDYFDKDAMVPKVPTGVQEYNGPWAALTSLWEKTFITGAKVAENGGFTISGFLEVIEKKPLNITTPVVSMSDDYSFFEETLGVLNEIALEMMGYFTMGNILESPRETLMEIAEYSTADMKGLNDQEVEEQLIEFLESRGAIMISPTDALMLEGRKKQEEPKIEESTDDQEPGIDDNGSDDPPLVEDNNPDQGPVTENEQDSAEQPTKEEPSAEEPPPAAPGGMTIPTGDAIPDPEIGEIVGKATLDNNVQEPALDEEGERRAEEIANQGDENGNW